MYDCIHESLFHPAMSNIVINPASEISIGVILPNNGRLCRVQLSRHYIMTYVHHDFEHRIQNAVACDILFDLSIDEVIYGAIGIENSLNVAHTEIYQLRRAIAADQPHKASMIVIPYQPNGRIQFVGINKEKDAATLLTQTCEHRRIRVSKHYTLMFHDTSAFTGADQYKQYNKVASEWLHNRTRTETRVFGPAFLLRYDNDRVLMNVDPSVINTSWQQAVGRDDACDGSSQINAATYYKGIPDGGEITINVCCDKHHVPTKPSPTGTYNTKKRDRQQFGPNGSVILRYSVMNADEDFYYTGFDAVCDAVTNCHIAK